MNSEDQSWKVELKDLLAKGASSVDDFIDIRWRKLRSRFGLQGVPQIQPYIGYANRDHVWLHGRVLENPPEEMPADDANWWDNVGDMYRRFASKEVPDAAICISIGAETFTTKSDKEGYFHLQANYARSSGSELWSTASYQIIDGSNQAAEHSSVLGRFLTVPNSARFGIISDVDDTIMHTSATQLLTVLKLTFMSNAKTRKPLDGVAGLYQALQNGSSEVSEQNPIFYVSSSPWNLFDVLEDFIDLNAIPLGPLLLRDLGFDEDKLLAEGHGHKLEKTRRILRAYPELPFLLVGDAGQDDAEIYATAAAEFGDQVCGIVIRDIDPGASSNYDQAVGQWIERARANGTSMRLVEDSTEAADLAIELGLIGRDSLESISRATRADRERSVLI